MGTRFTPGISYRAPRDWRRRACQADLDMAAAFTGTRLVLKPSKGTPPEPAPAPEETSEGLHWRDWRDWDDALVRRAAHAAKAWLLSAALPRLKAACGAAFRRWPRRKQAA